MTEGWAGADKMFLAEFSMPDTGAEEKGKNMPAAWLLHASIARTGQYTNCSCWKGDGESPQAGGCGEADIFEVLDPGNKKATSTFHFAHALGANDYFERPVGKAIKIAVVFQSSSAAASIKILDDGFDFSTTLTSSQVDGFLNDVSDFDLVSVMSFDS